MGRTINVGQDAFAGGDFKPIPTGTKLQASVYAIEETTVRSETSPNYGKPQLDVTFKITEPGEFNGREIRYQKIPLYDGTGAWKLVSFAEAVGWKAGAGEGVELPDNLQSVLGKGLIIKVNEDAPNAKNQVFNSVGGFAPLGSASSSPAAASSPGAGAPSWAGLNGS